MSALNFLRGLAVPAGAAVFGLAGAQAALARSFPTKPIRRVVPYAPAGGTDVLARNVAQKLSESMGQPVVVDNRAGADGVIGSEFVARSPGDGYTLMIASSSHAINPTLYSKITFDTARDLAASPRRPRSTWCW